METETPRSYKPKIVSICLSLKESQITLDIDEARERQAIQRS